MLKLQQNVSVNGKLETNGNGNLATSIQHSTTNGNLATNILQAAAVTNQELASWYFCWK